MKKCYLSIIILLSFNIHAEHVIKANPKIYQGSLISDPFFSESDFVFKQDNALPWIELERSFSNFNPEITNQITNFIQNGTTYILQERDIQHIYTNTKNNQDVVKSTSKEQQTITEPFTRQVNVTKINSLETENKSNCTEWSPNSDTKYTDETLEQTQNCDVETTDTYAYIVEGQTIDHKNISGSINKIFTQNVSGTKPLEFSSCKAILDAGKSTGDGTYTIRVSGQNITTTCDMTNGGWTKVNNNQLNATKIQNGTQYVKAITSISQQGVSSGVRVSGIFKNNAKHINLIQGKSLYTTSNYSNYNYMGGNNWFINNNVPLVVTADFNLSTVVFANGLVGYVYNGSNGCCGSEHAYLYYSYVGNNFEVFEK